MNKRIHIFSDTATKRKSEIPKTYMKKKVATVSNIKSGLYITTAHVLPHVMIYVILTASSEE